jgi:CDP-glycerol glycerophosphotransferase
MKFVFILDHIVPKKDNSFLISSNGGKFLSGNAKYLFDYLSKDPRLKVKFVNNSCDERSEDNISLKTFTGLIFFLQAKYLIGTHGQGDFFYPFSSKKIYVQTWHGTPIKKMGFCDVSCNSQAQNKIRQEFRKVNFFLSPSEFVTSLFIRCFGLAEEQILHIGNPRNDHLLSQNSTGTLAKRFGVSKVILYAPTFRDWTEVEWFPFKDFSFEDLNTTLEKLDAVILVRGHVNDKSECLQVQRIVNFGFDECVDINEVLGEIDLLITDYSSIYFDYLLVNKPSVFIMYDKATYEQKRGFLFEPNNTLLVGENVNSGEEFIHAIVNNLHIDKYKEARADAIVLFHQYQTKNSSETIKNKLLCKSS